MSFARRDMERITKLQWWNECFYGQTQVQSASVISSHLDQNCWLNTLYQACHPCISTFYIQYVKASREYHSLELANQLANI